MRQLRFATLLLAHLLHAADVAIEEVPVGFEPRAPTTGVTAEILAASHLNQAVSAALQATAASRPAKRRSAPGRMKAGQSPRKPRNDAEAFTMTMAYVQTALREWGMDVNDLDRVQTVKRSR